MRDPPFLKTRDSDQVLLSLEPAPQLRGNNVALKV